MTGAARIGLFSTLTSTGSRALMSTIARACREGRVPGAEVAFVFCNREPGESATTDASVDQIREEFGVPIVRASAVRFRPDERKAARERQAQGEPGPLWDWREAFYESYRDRLPATDLDLLLGDMWIWSASQCADRRGVNLHPALPTGPLGKMWFDVVWDLVSSEADVSGVMLHRVTPEVDRGPVVSYCRYGLHGPELDPLWASMPSCVEERVALIGTQRALKRDATHPLFHALRTAGLAREMPLMLETVRAVAENRLRFEHGRVVDGQGRVLPEGLDLTRAVEQAVHVGEGGS